MCMQILCLSISLLFAISVQAQNDPLRVVEKSLEILSVDPGVDIDANAFRACFHPEARFSVVNSSSTFPGPLEHASLDELCEQLKDDVYKHGYLEKMLEPEVWNGGHLAEVSGKFIIELSDEEPMYGNCSYQLVLVDDKWQILNALWTIFED